MKYKVLFLILFLPLRPLCQEHHLSFDLHGGPVADIDFSKFIKFRSIYITMNQFYTFNTGLDLRYNLNDRPFSLVSGYNFVYRFLKVRLFSDQEVIGNYYSGTRLYSSEVPLMLRYEKKTSNLNYFLMAGPCLDYMYAPQKYFGRAKTDTMIFVITTEVYYGLDFPLKLIPSLHTRIGFSNHYNKVGTFYCQLNYHWQFNRMIGNEMYYYLVVNGAPAQNDFKEFHVRSSYFGFELGYELPWGVF